METGPARGLQDSNCNLTTPDFLAAGPASCRVATAISLLQIFWRQAQSASCRVATVICIHDEWKYGILLAAEEVVRAGVLSDAPGSESEHVSLVSPFIDWSCFVGWCLFVGGGFVCFVWFFLAR